MATDSFKFWDSYMEALDPLDDKSFARVIRAVCHKVFQDIDPDFSDEPLLNTVYILIMRQAEQSRDIARRARENGSKSAGRPPKKSQKKPTEKPTGKPSAESGLTNRRERKRGESTDLPSLSLPDGVAAPPPDGGTRSAEVKAEKKKRRTYGSDNAVL